MGLILKMLDVHTKADGFVLKVTEFILKMMVCGSAFDPPAADLTNSLSGGLGHAVDTLRNISGLPPAPSPPGPVPAQ